MFDRLGHLTALSTVYFSPKNMDKTPVHYTTNPRKVLVRPMKSRYTGANSMLDTPSRKPKDELKGERALRKTKTMTIKHKSKQTRILISFKERLIQADQTAAQTEMVQDLLRELSELTLKVKHCDNNMKNNRN